MKMSGISEDAMAQVCEILALRNAIRKSITDEECKELFVDEQASFDVAEVII